MLLNEKPNDHHEMRNRTLHAARQLPSWLTFDVGQNPLAFSVSQITLIGMTRVQEIRQQATTLTISEKAELAADLLDCLPPVLDDEDEGLAEARRRDEEMDKDPAAAITWDQLRRGLGR